MSRALFDSTSSSPPVDDGLACYSRTNTVTAVVVADNFNIFLARVYLSNARRRHRHSDSDGHIVFLRAPSAQVSAPPGVELLPTGWGAKMNSSRSSTGRLVCPTDLQRDTV